jgi:two-component system phosphate regulon response regulator PhoB
VQLTPTEFRILHLLARRPGWVFTRNQIIEAAQGDEASVTARTVDVHMVALRRKLGACGDAIETIRGVGYRFQE